MKKPLFSIVMPTRNRAHLLRWALQSALQQDFHDFEIVVVNNDSSDDTEDVVKESGDERVSYVRSHKALSMPDNWEFAWGHARGDYVLYLCDDDALLPNTLSFLASHVQDNPPVICWDGAVYYWPDWLEAERRNKLTIALGDGRDTVRTWSSELILDELYSFVDMLWFPRMLNCCANRAMLEQVRRKLGRLFWRSCPDYSFMTIVLHQFPELKVVHKPLFIAGRSNSSIGATSMVKPQEATRQFEREFGGVDLYEGCPTRVPTVVNAILATYIQVHRVLRETGVIPHDINWEAHFVVSARQLAKIARHLPDHKTYESQLIRAAFEQSPECGARVQSILGVQRIFGRDSIVGTAARKLRGYGRKQSIDQAAPNTLGPGITQQDGYLTVDGEAAGAKSIFDMTKLVDDYFDRYATRPQVVPIGADEWRKESQERPT